jgi:hypothetical protein
MMKARGWRKWRKQARSRSRNGSQSEGDVASKLGGGESRGRHQRVAAHTIGVLEKLIRVIVTVGRIGRMVFLLLGGLAKCAYLNHDLVKTSLKCSFEKPWFYKAWF